MSDAAPRCWGCGCKLERDEPQPRYCVICWLAPGWTEPMRYTLEPLPDGSWSARPDKPGPDVAGYGPSRWEAVLDLIGKVNPDDLKVPSAT